MLLSGCERDERVKIPDDNFLNKLIELGVDENGDGHISTAEAESITTLNVFGIKISDLTGIEEFVNLSDLNCSFNYLTALDISNNTTLKKLDCTGNLLATLNVANNTALSELYCSINKLATLNISNNPLLTSLHCTENSLFSLNVSNDALLELNCNFNELTSLDVSNITGLISLGCAHNKLTTLDVSNNTSLCTLMIAEMTSLYKVCVWEMPFPPAGVEVYMDGSPNIYFTTDCSK
jgi:Leucine-rich repeat (LRR) protein